MKRLYFIAPDVPAAKRVVDELLLARIEERHIHVIAKEGTPLEDLPAASLWQQSDLAHAMERGLALGGATGALAGLVAISLPESLVLGGGAILLATTLAGAGVGSWAASFQALNIPNVHLQQFQKEVEQGRILMLVDVPKARVDDIRRLIHRTHREIADRGIEKTIPPFP